MPSHRDDVGRAALPRSRAEPAARVQPARRWLHDLDGWLWCGDPEQSGAPRPPGSVAGWHDRRASHSGRQPRHRKVRVAVVLRPQSVDEQHSGAPLRRDQAAHLRPARLDPARTAHRHLRGDCLSRRRARRLGAVRRRQRLRSHAARGRALWRRLVHHSLRCGPPALFWRAGQPLLARHAGAVCPAAHHRRQLCAHLFAQRGHHHGHRRALSLRPVHIVRNTPRRH
mmetsp:Transcript_40458/g.100627  ORF Transcript_40458/g.100627 Transcript_40458/m.100627 type:complete len:226 (-) Transcript_40458:516-1193(-)